MLSRPVDESLIAEISLHPSACEIVRENFDHINQTECSVVKIRLFYYDASHTQNTYLLKSS